jgi:site-specific recombinase XerD
MIEFPELLQAFFTDRLISQRRASEHTVAAYRDTFRLLLHYAHEQLGKMPGELVLEDLNAPFIGSFLDHLEKTAGICPASRNLRLAAIRSFFHYIAFQAPGHAALIQRVLAIPRKRQDRPVIEYLTKPEIEALLSAPDRNTWAGRRDHALLLLAIQTGLRVSELIGLRCKDLALGTGPHVRCDGKGRKARCTPLRKDTVKIMCAWVRELTGLQNEPLFPSARGGHLSADGIQYLLAKHLRAARRACPSLEKKRVSPHVLRHTAAMNLLLAGVDRSLIALWLGHESVETTQMYLSADIVLKEKILAQTAPFKTRPGRYRPDDSLLAFLKSL